MDVFVASPADCQKVLRGFLSTLRPAKAVVEVVGFVGATVKARFAPTVGSFFDLFLNIAGSRLRWLLLQGSPLERLRASFEWRSP